MRSASSKPPSRLLLYAALAVPPLAFGWALGGGRIALVFVGLGLAFGAVLRGHDRYGRRGRLGVWIFGFWLLPSSLALFVIVRAFGRAERARRGSWVRASDVGAIFRPIVLFCAAIGILASGSTAEAARAAHDALAAWVLGGGAMILGAALVALDFMGLAAVRAAAPRALAGRGAKEKEPRDDVVTVDFGMGAELVEVLSEKEAGYRGVPRVTALFRGDAAVAEEALRRSLAWNGAFLVLALAAAAGIIVSRV